ncbi:MAG TPA: TonB family protein [Candidatus Acidoferrum sp.]|nr:TonB family protein [Candidatus Acidoferrum sp.]
MQTGTKRERDKPAQPATPDRNQPQDFGSNHGQAVDALAKSQANAVDDSLIEFSPHGELPRLDLGIDWGSPWREFRSSAHDFLSGERAPKNHELPADSDLRVHWIEGKNSPWAFAASSVWHVLAVALLILPIWGFLPSAAHTLAPPDIEVSWTAPRDLPPIHLPAPISPAPKPEHHAQALRQTPQKELAAPKGADAFHPRQTILSIPVRITHPRQTLIQPAAPMTPPKISPQLPNLVQWAASTPAPEPELQLTVSAAAPRMRQRQINAVAPDIANLEKNPGPLNIAPSPAVSLAPQMPIAPMSAAVARFRGRQVAGAAPQVNATAGDPSLRNVVALSASPVPPAPVVEVPRGNLAARVAISPVGTHRGAPEGTSSGSGGAARPLGGRGSLPAAVSVSGGNSHGATSGGGIGASHPPSRLLLKPMSGLSERPKPRTGPADVAGLAPNERPEDLFAGKEIHSLNIALPNVTSMTGNWALNFAQLDDGNTPFSRPTGILYGPVPVTKVDPKYPVEAIRENIEGEVVLYAIIRANGSVDSIQVVRHLDPLVDREAVAALAQWKFRPATRDGKPVDVEAIVHIPFNYKLPEP